MEVPHYIDPVPSKAQRFLQAGESDALLRARMVWGEQSDYDSLCERLEVLPDDGLLRVVDLTSVQSLGERARLKPLEDYGSRHPTVMVLRRGVAMRYSEIIRNPPVSLVTVDEGVSSDDGSRMPPFNIYSVDLPKAAKDSDPLSHYDFFGVGRSWSSVSWWLTNHRLATLVCNHALRRPPENHRYSLPDGTEANLWLDVKKLISEPGNAIEVAYYCARTITSEFRGLQRQDGSQAPFTLLVGNHPAAAIATLVRALIGPCVGIAVFDQMGPQAYLARARIDVMRPLPREVIIIEDVLSSGREIDFIALLALVRGSDITQVICVYDLEIAHPRLIPPARVVSLSRPAKLANYSRSAIVPLRNREAI
jgi:hypothetical protein